VKFTPAGGAVRISLLPGGDGPIIRVADTGPGIDPADREAVTRRFYRADKSRGTQGVGLGLSLVAAIVKRHDFTLVISVGPGCVVDLACRAARVASTRAIGSPPLAVSLPLGGSVHLGMSSPAGASVPAEVSVPLRARHLPVQ